MRRDYPFYSDMIEAIYDSAVDPSRWSGFFDLLNAAGDFHSGALMVMEPERRTTRFSRHWGVDIELLRSIEARHSDDPTMVFLHSLADPERDPDEPVVYRQVFDDAFLARSPLYHEISQQVAISDSIAILSLLKPGRVGFLTALRQHGDVFGAREVALMRRLAPHIRRAVTISDMLDMRSLEGDAMAATLDALVVGVLIVSADARVLHANTIAKAMLDDGTALRLSMARLSAAGEQETKLLALAIASAALPRQGLIADGGERPVAGAQGVLLPVSGGTSAMAHVLPLANSGLRFAPSAVAAVFVTMADGSTQSHSADAIWAMFGLTSAEQRLASELASGATLSAAAEALGISENTAKTHIGRIYAKVGVSRHAELVALAARLTPPLRSPT